MAAVSDITSRDAQLQSLLARSTSMKTVITNELKNVCQPPSPQPALPPPSPPRPQLLPYTTTSLYQSREGNRKVHLADNYHHQSMGSEYVDINEMDIVEHRTTATNHIDSSSQKNLLVRRSQRRLKKDEDRKPKKKKPFFNKLYLISLFSVLVSDKHVPCRAWASLPTSYLQIVAIDGDSNGNVFTAF